MKLGRISIGPEKTRVEQRRLGDGTAAGIAERSSAPTPQRPKRMRIMQVKMPKKPASSMKISGIARCITAASPASIAAGIRSPSGKVTKCDQASTPRASTSAMPQVIP